MRSNLPTNLFVVVLAATCATASNELFERRITLPVGAWPSHTLAADLDDDGDLDLLVTQFDLLTIYENNGHGEFSPGLSIPAPVGQSFFQTIAADIDSDGDLDLGSLSPATGRALFYIDKGGDYSLASWYGNAGGNPRDLKLADADEDGDWDLAYLSDWSQCYLPNFAGGKFGGSACWGPAAPQMVRGLAIIDMNADGHMEYGFAGVMNTGGPDMVFIIDHDQLSVMARLRFPHPVAVAGGDVDQDGRGDLVIVGGFTSATAQVASLPAGTRVVKMSDPFRLGGTSAHSATLADLDLDGRLDLITGNEPDNTLSILLNAGGSFSSPNVLPAGESPVQVLCADLDHDGAPDLVATNKKSGNLTIYFNGAASVPSSVSEYCQGKINSKGQLAHIGAANVPSAGADGFSIHLRSAITGQVAILLESQAGPANLPFANGTLCVQPPIERLPTQQVIKVSGIVGTAIPVNAAMVGTKRWYQWWYRDPNHPDGTAAGLSSALEVTFSW